MSETTNENVAARTPASPVAMDDVARQLLDEARQDSQGRSALALTPTGGKGLSQTVIGLLEGNSLGPRSWNSAATLLVLRGAGTLGDKELVAGWWTEIDGETELTASEDLVALLTVAPVVG